MTTYRVTSMRPSTAEELAGHARLKEMASNQLPSVRAAAERWRAGAGLSGGAVTVAGLLTAPEVIRNATHSQIEQGLLVLGATVLIGLVAVGLGLRASIGWPAVRNIASGEALLDWERSEVRTSIRCLRWSMRLSILTIAFAALAASILIFGFDLSTFQIPPAAVPEE